MHKKLIEENIKKRIAEQLKKDQEIEAARLKKEKEDSGFTVPHLDIKEGNLVFRNLVTANFMMRKDEKQHESFESFGECSSKEVIPNPISKKNPYRRSSNINFMPKPSNAKFIKEKNDDSENDETIMDPLNSLQIINQPSEAQLEDQEEKDLKVALFMQEFDFSGGAHKKNSSMTT